MHLTLKDYKYDPKTDGSSKNCWLIQKLIDSFIISQKVLQLFFTSMIFSFTETVETPEKGETEETTENETPETSEETPESQAEETETDETGSEKQEEVLEELFDEEPTEETTTHTEEL